MRTFKCPHCNSTISRLDYEETIVQTGYYLLEDDEWSQRGLRILTEPTFSCPICKKSTTPVDVGVLM